jgi:hypothetical protein
MDATSAPARGISQLFLPCYSIQPVSASSGFAVSLFTRPVNRFQSCSPLTVYCRGL